VNERTTQYVTDLTHLLYPLSKAEKQGDGVILSAEEVRTLLKTLRMLARTTAVDKTGTDKASKAGRTGT